MGGEGHRIKGPVTLHTNDEIFRQDAAWMKEARQISMQQLQTMQRSRSIRQKKS